MPSRSFSHWPTVAGALALTVASFWPLQAHALFDDKEARKAILDLRQKFDAYRAEMEARFNKQAAEIREGDAANQRSLLEMSNQNEQLRSEMARLRGQNEQLARELSDLQRQQKDVQAGVKDVQAGVDARLKQVEPAKVSLDGADFNAQPEEKRSFDAAMEVLRKADFPGATVAYGSFLRRYPGSGYTPSVLYWLGNAQYAQRAYKEAIDSHTRLVSQYPSHLRAPEAMLALANSQLEIKDNKAAQRTLESLVRTYPQSEAAAAGRERLSRLR